MLPTNETSWFSRSSSGRIWRGVAACVTFLALASAGVAAQTPSPDEVAVQEVERLFDEFQFEPAIAGLDLLLGRLSAAPSRPDATGIDAIRAVMSRAHELRARARFNLGQLAEADADFEALVRLDAGYRLADDMSPRVLEAFDLVRSRLVGLVFLTMDPPGQVTIDDRVYFMASPRETFEVVTGDHTVTASLPGYRDAVRDITIERGGGSVSLEVVLTRVSGSLTVATVPAGVEVVVDQEARGQTRPGIRDTGPSSPVLVLDLLPGQHRLRLVRDCYAVYDVPFNIPEPPVDVDVGAIELQPAVATATIVSAGPEALVYLDGERRGPASEPIAGICEGPHVVEVRSSEGRFIDRRDWRAGDAVTLDASLRQAFALIDTDDGTGTLNREVAGLVEAAVGDARSVMVFVPIESELAAAAASGGDSPAVPSLTTAQRRTSGEQWTARLDVQGVAWLSPDAAGSDAYRLNLLAGGSGVPDVIPLRLSDLGSRAAAAQALSVTPSAIVRTSLQASVVDVAGVTGAAVVRVVEGGTSAGAGLAAGDVIFNVGADRGRGGRRSARRARPNRARRAAVAQRPRAAGRAVGERTGRRGARRHPAERSHAPVQYPAAGHARCRCRGRDAARRGSRASQSRHRTHPPHQLGPRHPGARAGEPAGRLGCGGRHRRLLARALPDRDQPAHRRPGGLPPRGDHRQPSVHRWSSGRGSG